MLGLRRFLLLLLLSGAAALALAACDGRVGGVLGADLGDGGGGRTDTSGGGGGGDAVVPPDVPLGDRDVLFRDLPPTDWTAPADGFDPVHSIESIQRDDIGLTCDPSTQFLNYPDPRDLTGLVVLSPPWDVTTTKNGYYVAEAPGAWHGIQLVVSKDIDPGLLPGDVIDVSGEAKEFYCLTQFEAADPPTVKGTSSAGGSVAEPYEGALVRLTNVTVADTAGWGFTLGEHAVVVQDAFQTGVRPNVGCPIASLTGVVTYSFEEYKVVPLRAEDVVFADEEACGGGGSGGGDIQTVQELQQAPESAQCDSYDQSSGIYPAAGDDLTFEGLVVTTPLVYVSSNLRGYYLQAPESAPWTGVLATFFKDDDPGLAPGDQVTVKGDWQEFRCLTQLKVATPVATNFTKTGTTDVPAPVAVDAARLASDAAYAESFEGVLVRVTDQVVATPPDAANHMQVAMESGLVLDDVAFFEYEPLTFSAGQGYASITGVLFGDTFTEGRYLLAPRSAADFEPAPAE